MSPDDLKILVERLTGQPSPLEGRPEVLDQAIERLNGVGLGYSQLNELLLALGHDRVDPSFFQYLVDSTTGYVPGSVLQGLRAFEDAVREFQILGLLLFGNCRFAFKKLSSDPEYLEAHLRRLAPVDRAALTERHDAVHPVEPIAGEDAYFLGYLVERELKDVDRADPRVLQRKEIVEIGKRNHEAYLTSDHLDVYVATSMRERHEFLQIHEWTQEIFEHGALDGLKLRWFDPTQAYCPDRIDKGLAEALMLKRAKCTLYLAQESDTLGKNSELASTLAQGKSVIAYVPEGTEAEAQRLLDLLERAYPEATRNELLLEQLQIFDPGSAWGPDPLVRQWIDDPSTLDQERLYQRFVKSLGEHYDKRAETLKRYHPLGIQVDLSTGVANGVLVARTEDVCARLIERIVTGTLQFDLELPADEEDDSDHPGYSLLREKLSGSIFRVMTGDRLLSNSFWNFYNQEPVDF